MLKIGHLYPDSMNLYGDRGNVLTLLRRAQWRQIPASVVPLESGEAADFSELDLLFMGGGEDRHQAEVAEDLLARGQALTDALDSGLPMLAICGAYQLLGHYYETAGGKRLPGLAFLPVYTTAGKTRSIGNVVVDSSGFNPEIQTLVGFENHGGVTRLLPEARPLGKVLKGFGNNGEDGSEGVVHRHVIGTYLHGSLLPKNPRLADTLLKWALERQGIQEGLPELPDAMEQIAHRRIVERELHASSRRG